VQELSPSSLVDLLTTYRYSVGSETSFQLGVERVLAENDVPFIKEHQLGSEFGRIDFYLPHHKYGIELKVKGSVSEVLRQLHRYAQCPDIAALILVTARARLAFAPMSINGRPLLAAAVWESQL